MGIRNTYHQALMRACMAVGDEAELAKRLGVPLQLMIDWLLGEKPVPPEIFLRVVDLVLESSNRHVVAVRDFLEGIRRRHRKPGAG